MQWLFYFQPLELGQLSLGTGGLLFWGCLHSSLFIAGISTAAASVNKQDLKLPSRHEGCAVVLIKQWGEGRADAEA